MHVRCLTGISANHFLEATLMARSLRRHEPTVPLVVVNLINDLSVSQIRAVRTWQHSELCEMDKDYHLLSPRVRASGLTNCAWKVMAIRSVLLLQKPDILIYLDASSRIQRPFDRLVGAMGHLPVLGRATSGPLMSWTHPAMLARLRGDRQVSFEGAPVVCGCVLAFQRRLAAPLVKEWHRCANNSDCIFPPGAVRGKRCVPAQTCHRDDQSALSALLWMRYPNVSYLSGLVSKTVSTSRSSLK